MMISEQIQKDLVQSMKNKDALRTSVLRMIKSAFKNREIEKRASLSDVEAVQVLKSLSKQRAESIEQFEAGRRPDLADKERQEKKIIESYLPAAVSAEEMEDVVSAVIEETHAASPKDLGVVMKQAMARLQATGKTVDGKAVNALVRSRLGAPDKTSSG